VNIVFLKTKGQTCDYCYEWIEKGELAVHIRYQDAGGFWHLFYWHRDCYVTHIEEKIQRGTDYLLWLKVKAMEHQEEERKNRKPRGRPRKSRGKPGRPRKSIYYLERRKLMHLLYYHRKRHNEERIAELEEGIRGLEILQ